MRPNGNIESLEEKAAEVSATLRLLANQKRLLLLCRLALEGEMSVTALGRVVKPQPVGTVAASGKAQSRRCRDNPAREPSPILPHRRRQDRAVA